MITTLVFAVLDHVWNFINECSHDSKKRKTYISDEKCFSRNRILTFITMVGIILSSRKSNIETNINEFRGWPEDTDAEKKMVTKGAFTQQREKINSDFFVMLLEVFRDSFYTNYGPQIKKWKDWVVVAIDGSRISLPYTDKIKETFGSQKHAKSDVESPIARASFAYDPFNNIILTGHLVPKGTSEMSLAIADILALSGGKLYLMDRGYCSFLILYLLISKGNKFVVRAKTRQLKAIRIFLEKGLKDGYIEMKAYQKAVRQLKEKGYGVKNGQTISVRAVKVPLTSGETEVLLTNLTPEEASVSELAELYHYRWGEEVAIGILKNEQQLEIFTGLSENSIMQDFFATLFMYNFEMMLEKLEEERIQLINKQHEKKGMLPVAIDHNECWNSTKKIFKHWLLAPDSQISHKELLKILPLFTDVRYSVRKDRKFPRTFRVIKLLGKYITLPNYRAVG